MPISRPLDPESGIGISLADVRSDLANPGIPADARRTGQTATLGEELNAIVADVGIVVRPGENLAAIYAAAPVGSCVTLRPGTYAVNVVLRDGVHLHLDAGVTLTNGGGGGNTQGVLRDGGGNISCRVTGAGRIADQVGVAALDLMGTGTVSVETDSLHCDAGTINLRGKHRVRAREITSATYDTILYQGAHVAGDTCTVEAVRIVAKSDPITQEAPAGAPSGRLVVNARTIEWIDGLLYNYESSAVAPMECAISADYYLTSAGDGINAVADRVTVSGGVLPRLMGAVVGTGEISLFGVTIGDAPQGLAGYRLYGCRMASGVAIADHGQPLPSAIAPTVYPTFAAFLAAPAPTVKRLVTVTADETNGGDSTDYYHLPDGSRRWVPALEL